MSISRHHKPLKQKHLALLAVKLLREGRMPTPDRLAASLSDGALHVAGTPTERSKRSKKTKLARSKADGYHKAIVSSSTREGSTLADAKAGHYSPEFQNLILDSYRAPGAEGGQSGYSFWVDGAEESRIVNVTQPPILRTLLATLGKKYNQKSVVGFESQPGGRDIAHVLSVPSSDVQSIADGFLERGIPYKTIIPKVAEGRSEVHIFDEDGGLSKQVAAFAQANKADHKQHVGKVHFIGGDTPEEGQHEYDKILNGP